MRVLQGRLNSVGLLTLETWSGLPDLRVPRPRQIAPDVDDTGENVGLSSSMFKTYTAMCGLLLGASLMGCSNQKHAAGDEATPPPATQAWMDRLTVDHHYDPVTGFIVADEVIGLPAVITDGPPLSEAMDRSREQGRVLVVFATADRCAPCQQYKKTALNDAAVIDALEGPDLIVTHVEVDRDAEEAQAVLGSLGIPMTYAFRDGEQIAVLRGQRSAEELRGWLESLSGA